MFFRLGPSYIDQVAVNIHFGSFRTIPHDFSGAKSSTYSCIFCFIITKLACSDRYLTSKNPWRSNTGTIKAGDLVANTNRQNMELVGKSNSCNLRPQEVFDHSSVALTIFPLPPREYMNQPFSLRGSRTTKTVILKGCRRTFC